MNGYDRRHHLGCKAVGMIQAYHETGLMDEFPSIKKLAKELVDEFNATFDSKSEVKDDEAEQAALRG